MLSLAFHLYSIPLYLNLRDLQVKSDFLSGHLRVGSQDVRARLVYDLAILFDGHLGRMSCELSIPTRLIRGITPHSHLEQLCH